MLNSSWTFNDPVEGEVEVQLDPDDIERWNREGEECAAREDAELLKEVRTLPKGFFKFVNGRRQIAWSRYYQPQLLDSASVKQLLAEGYDPVKDADVFEPDRIDIGYWNGRPRGALAWQYGEGPLNYTDTLDDLKIAFDDAFVSGLSEAERLQVQKTAIENDRLKKQTILKTEYEAPVIDHTAEPLETVEESPESAIPEFDPSVINGIYADFVELVTRGTTLQPQYAYTIAKTVVGIRMAGKVKFDDLDVEPRLYATLIGETGSGKGEAWRRTEQILKAPGLIGGCGFKITNDADSGAGLKDLFFPPPKMEPEQCAAFVPKPVLCFIDEITTIGHKSAETRNPGIVDELITLANSTSISRNLAKRSGGSRSTDQARLAIVMCGQSGEVFQKAFAGRTKVGWYDRLYPEYGVPVEAGDLPPVDPAAAMAVLQKLGSLDHSGTMTMSADAKSLLDGCWNSQPSEVRKKARWRSNLKLDAYMSAFGCGRKIVEAEDAKIAITIFARQLKIREACFTMEAPDRVGFYYGAIKRVTEKMIQQLKDGVPPERVAKSQREYEQLTHAYRDNEVHIFDRAWQSHVRTRLYPITIKKENGHQYQKYLPVPEE